MRAPRARDGGRGCLPIGIEHESTGKGKGGEGSEVKMEQGKEEEERRGKSLYKIMPIVLLLVILIAIMIPSSRAEQQQQILWNKTWGGSDSDYGQGIGKYCCNREYCYNRE